jgi:hypothetical protein
VTVTLLGPLRLATFAGGRGFVTYGPLPDLGPDAFGQLVPDALEQFRDDPDITRIEWKTRGHDTAPGLHEALVHYGFVPDERESIMIGETSDLAGDVPLPAGVILRQITDELDVRAMSAMEDEAFGDEVSDDRAEALLHRLGRDDGMELWVAEVEGKVVSAGRLEPVPDSDFAGIWGGATLSDWRGRGIYRAVTAARARSALAQRKSLIHSDSTEYSRPILERSGLMAVSTTTPYRWSRSG